MKLIIVNELINSNFKTQLLRNLEVVLMSNKLLKESQLKKFRKMAANDILKIINQLSDPMKQNIIKIM